MHYIEKILIALSVILFVLKELSIPFAGICFSCALFLLAIFYLTSKVHIFRSKDFKTSITIISSLILSISILYLNLYFDHLSFLLRPILVILVIQVLWLLYLYLKENNTKELYKRIVTLFFVTLLMAIYVYLINLLKT